MDSIIYIFLIWKRESIWKRSRGIAGGGVHFIVIYRELQRLKNKYDLENQSHAHTIVIKLCAFSGELVGPIATKIKNY